MAYFSLTSAVPLINADIVTRWVMLTWQREIRGNKGSLLNSAAKVLNEWEGKSPHAAE